MTTLLFIALAFSVNTLLITRLRGMGIPAHTLTVFWFGLVFLMIIGDCVRTGASPLSDLRLLLVQRRIEVMALLMTAALCGAVGNLLFVHHAARIPVPMLQSARCLECVLVAVLTVIMVRFRIISSNQTPTPQYWIGLALIFAGFVLTSTMALQGRSTTDAAPASRH